MDEAEGAGAVFTKFCRGFQTLLRAAPAPRSTAGRTNLDDRSAEPASDGRATAAMTSQQSRPVQQPRPSIRSLGLTYTSWIVLIWLVDHRVAACIVSRTYLQRASMPHFSQCSTLLVLANQSRANTVQRNQPLSVYVVFPLPPRRVDGRLVCHRG